VQLKAPASRIRVDLVVNLITCKYRQYMIEIWKILDNSALKTPKNFALFAQGNFVQTKSEADGI
jgi:hypothetical protein